MVLQVVCRREGDTVENPFKPGLPNFPLQREIQVGAGHGVTTASKDSCTVARTRHIQAVKQA